MNNMGQDQDSLSIKMLKKEILGYDNLIYRPNPLNGQPEIQIPKIPTHSNPNSQHSKSHGKNIGFKG
jgi:hypothetical protein